MNTRRLVLSAVLATLLVISPLVGCSACGELPEEDTAFSYSKGIDENGFWEGIRALDYVELFDYEGLEIPSDAHEITDEAVEEEVASLLASFTTTKEVTDRAAADGDTLNVDYVGTIDGVEFEGGSTGGQGTEIIIGETNYIDDFIEQLIGHNTGENFDIEVTFPDDYTTEDLQGKDAVFNVTINSISETVEPELTDAWVKENLFEDEGWSTIDEMKQGLKEDLEEAAVHSYVQDYLANDVTVSALPESILSYQEQALAHYYESYATMYGVELEEFLTSYVGVASMEELLENSQEDVRLSTVYSLAVQAVAEDAGFTVSDEDITTYFTENMGEADYSSYEEEYGMPYLKQSVLSQKVLDYIIEHAKLL